MATKIGFLEVPLITEILNEDPQTSDAETSIELNFAVLKFKHTVKKRRGK